jgi:dipeptidyl aminopeptidase/acylaminoacyl peptidase
MRYAIGGLLALVLAPGGGAQKRLDLTVDTIMRGPQLAGYTPSDARWSGDSQRIYFRWKQCTDPPTKPLDTYVVNRDGTGLQKLTDEEAAAAPPATADFTRDRRMSVYSHEGDIWIYDYSTDKARRLTWTAEAETQPHFTRDGKRIAFLRANNLYVITIDRGEMVQMTDIRPAGSPPSEPKKGTESQEFAKKEERELLESVRDKAQQREEEEARKKRENPRKPYILAARQTVTWIQLTPDEKYVIAGFTQRAEDAKHAVVPNYVTESSYPEDIEGHTMAGDVRDKSQVAVISAQTGELKWLEHKPEATVGQPVWSEDGTKAVLLARAVDNKDRWLLALDPATAQLREIAHDRDDAWVGGPASQTIEWLKSDREVAFVSERSGYAHLYAVPYDGGEAQPLTSGKWEVLVAELSPDKSTFYLRTNDGGPEQQHLWSMPSAGGARTKITSLPGDHHTVLSRDERSIADIHSYTNQPYELYAMENRPGAEERKLTSSPSPEFSTYPWLDVPLVHFRARDGVEIPARLYRPANFRRGGPAVIFVHGAGYLQDVHKFWSYYFREYMFHHLLVERGYLVFEIDYRGSAGYGRDWRTAIYEHMGGKDLDDHVDAARWIVSQYGVDPKRIGIYGGSYGGFMTLMAMFTQPDVFAAGAALRPVTDWSHYNNSYTVNILNPPQKDPEAYKRSSPIYFASGLKGPLLICHGMVDTNVFFQDSVRLTEKLIELGKDNWELAPYPAEDHAFLHATSWADEYKRILKLFDENLQGRSDQRKRAGRQE